MNSLTNFIEFIAVIFYQELLALQLYLFVHSAIVS